MDRARKFVLAFYILTLMTFGFWVNITSFTLIIDVAGIMMLLYSAAISDGIIRIQSEYKTIFIEAALFFVGIAFITIISWMRTIPMKMCILGARDYFEFIFLGFLVIPLLPDTINHERFLKYITVFSVVMCSFGIAQFVFHASMPKWLLHVRSGRMDYVYGLGRKIFRINGLFENTIVFNGIIIISSALTFATLLEKGRSFFRILGFGITVVANVLTFSRVALVGSAMIYALEYLLFGKKNRTEKYVRILALGLLGILLFMTLASDTALYQRLFNSSITSSSDIVHLSTIARARKAVSENWFLGLGMGTQGYDSSGSTVSVIRDGCWLQFALELGMPLTLLLGTMLLSLLVIAKRRLNVVRTDGQKISCGVFIVITLYFAVASLINSSFNAKEVFGLYWVLAGMMLWNPPPEQEKEGIKES